MDVLMPQLGETVAEGKITKWFKAAGDKVVPGDNLFEIETDKVSMEVPAADAVPDVPRLAAHPRTRAARGGGGRRPARPAGGGGRALGRCRTRGRRPTARSRGGGGRGAEPRRGGGGGPSERQPRLRVCGEN